MSQSGSVEKLMGLCVCVCVLIMLTVFFQIISQLVYFFKSGNDVKCS